MMRFPAYDMRRRLLLGLAAICLGWPGAENHASAQGNSAAGGEQLTISLPEVVVESPSIEHLIAARVRPVPPKRLGVRLPPVFIKLEAPSIRLPARPIPEGSSDLPRRLLRLACTICENPDLHNLHLRRLRCEFPSVTARVS